MIHFHGLSPLLFKAKPLGPDSRIQDIRTLLGQRKTRAEIAEALGMSVSNVNNYMRKWGMASPRKGKKKS